MGIHDFLGFINLAKEKEKKERIREQWLQLLPFMSMNLLKYMSLEEYEELCTGKNIDLRSTEEIIADIEETHRKAKEGGT